MQAPNNGQALAEYRRADGQHHGRSELLPQRKKKKKKRAGWGLPALSHVFHQITFRDIAERATLELTLLDGSTRRPGCGCSSGRRQVSSLSSSSTPNALRSSRTPCGAPVARCGQ
jgi:hypothetical protein